MKEKIRFSALLVLGLVLLHLILVAGCGKNPLVSAIVGSGTVKVVKL